MNAFERALAKISPGWALSRARASVAFNSIAKIRGDGDGQSDRLKRVRSAKLSQDARNQQSAEKLRAEARWLEETYDIAKGALDVLVANIIGPGIQPEPQVMLKGGKELAQDVNMAMLKLWDEWIHTPEVTREYDYYTMQGLTARSWCRDGDIFGQHLVGSIPSLDHGTVAPYSLEMLEGDFVPYDLTDPSRNIVQGVELNSWGRPRAYHVYKGHPGDRGVFFADTKRISADRMMHLKRTNRFHSTRGLTEFATVIGRCGDIKEIDESERVAARVAAAMAGYIKKGSPDSYSTDGTNPGTAQALRMMEFVPGMIFDDLLPGEEIGTISNNRPNNALIPFRDSQIKCFSSGIGAGNSSVSKNYTGTYSAQRQELVEQYVMYRRLTGTFIFRFCTPIWDNFVLSILSSQAIRIPRSVDMETIFDATHTPPPMPWIDPLKEALANDLLERRKFKSRPRIIRERGDVPDQVNREIQRDAEERARMGIVQESTSGAPTGQDFAAPEAPDQEPDEDAEEADTGSDDE